MNQPPAPPTNYEAQPPPKRKRRWPWILLGLLLGMILIPAGCVALFAAGVEEAADQAEERRTEIQADIESCRVIAADELSPSWFTIECSVRNNSSERSNYTWSVGATVDGARYGTTAFFVDNVRAGEQATVTSTLIPDAEPTAPPEASSIELEVFDVTRFSAE